MYSEIYSCQCSIASGKFPIDNFCKIYKEKAKINA
jgi:hypothetical protein